MTEFKKTCNEINTLTAEAAHLDMIQAYVLIGAVWAMLGGAVWVLV